MTMKSVTVNLREENIAPVVNNIVSLIFKRVAETIETTSNSLNKKFQNDEVSAEQYAVHINKFIKHYRKAVDELENLLPFCAELPSLSSETEVLEDLSDLKEDSLGVGSGGE